LKVLIYCFNIKFVAKKENLRIKLAFFVYKEGKETY